MGLLAKSRHRTGSSSRRAVVSLSQLHKSSWRERTIAGGPAPQLSDRPASLTRARLRPRHRASAIAALKTRTSSFWTRGTPAATAIDAHAEKGAIGIFASSGKY